MWVPTATITIIAIELNPLAPFPAGGSSKGFEGGGGVLESDMTNTMSIFIKVKKTPYG